MTDLVLLLRSLSFGGLVGAGLGATAAALLPLGVSLEAASFIGAATGTASHQIIERLSSSYIGSTVGYYSRVLQILLIGRFFGVRFQRELLEDLTRKHFLGEGPRRGQRNTEVL